MSIQLVLITLSLIYNFSCNLFFVLIEFEIAITTMKQTMNVKMECPPFQKGTMKKKKKRGEERIGKRGGPTSPRRSRVDNDGTHMK